MKKKSTTYPMRGFTTRQLKRSVILIHRRTNKRFHFPSKEAAQTAGKQLRQLIDNNLTLEADLMELIKSARDIISAGQSETNN